jgi:hypothetical protein
MRFMSLPKYITHPTLLILGGILIYLLVASQIPSSEELKADLIKSQNESHEQILKSILPTELLPIQSVSLDGTINISHLRENKNIKVNHPLFQNLNTEQHKKLSTTLTGKLLYWPENKPLTPEITLPVKVYDRSCFEENNPVKSAGVFCPLILEP